MSVENLSVVVNATILSLEEEGRQKKTHSLQLSCLSTSFLKTEFQLQNPLFQLLISSSLLFQLSTNMLNLINKQVHAPQRKMDIKNEKLQATGIDYISQRWKHLCFQFLGFELPVGRHDSYFIFQFRYFFIFNNQKFIDLLKIFR